jgi:hypothetical protein
MTTLIAEANGTTCKHDTHEVVIRFAINWFGWNDSMVFVT